MTHTSIILSYPFYGTPNSYLSSLLFGDLWWFTTYYFYTMYCTTYIHIIQQEVRIIHSGLIGCFLCSNNFTLPHCNTEQKVMKISQDQVVQCPKALWSWVWAGTSFKKSVVWALLTETLIFYYVLRDLHKQRFLNYVLRVLQSEPFTG